MVAYILLMLAMLGADPQPMTVPAPNQSAVKDLILYKRITENFEVISLDDKQGESVARQIESIKQWSLERWDLEGDKDRVCFSHRCVIVIVPNESVLNKLFHIDRSFAEDRDNGGVAWVCYTEIEHTRVLSVLLTEIFLKEFETQHKMKIAYWAKRGIAVLNGNPKQIKKFLQPMYQHISSDRGMFFTESLFGLEKDTVMRSTPENISLFDKEAALLCLLLRKEFGNVRFLSMVGGSGLKKSTGYNSYSEFDSAFKRYVFYATEDIVRNKMPDFYLNIGGAR